MKLACPFWLFAFFLALAALPTAAASVHVQEALARYQARDEGTQNESEFIGFLIGYAQQLNLKVSRRYFDYLERAHSFSSSIEVVLPGSSQDEMVYALSVNSSNAALMAVLQLMADLNQTKDTKGLTVGARFLFLGAENGESVLYPIGTRDFLRDYSIDGNSGIIYLDVRKPAEELWLSNDGQRVTPLWLLSNVDRVLSFAGMKTVLPSVRTLAQRAKFFQRNGKIDPYLADGFSAVLISSENSADSRSQLLDDEAWSNRFAAAFGQWHQNLAKINAEQDRHYFIVGDLFISEQVYVVFLLVFFLTLIWGSLNFRAAYQASLRILQKNAWEFALLLPLVFLFLFLASLIIENLLISKNDTNFWRYTPLTFGILKISLAVFLSSFFFRIIKALGMANYPRLYSAAAVFFSLFNIIFFALIDISLSFFWIWFFVGSLLFHWSKIGLVRRALLILAPSPLILIGIAIFFRNYYELIEFFLFSHIWGNFLLALLVFPSLLLGLSFYHERRRRYGSLRIPWMGQLVLTGLFSFSCLWIVFYQPYSGRRAKQPISLLESEDLTLNVGTVRLISPRAMGDLDLTIGGRSLPIKNAPQSVTVSLTPYRSLHVSAVKTDVLNRQNLETLIEPEGHPTYIHLIFSGNRPFGAVDCDFPFSIEDPDTAPNRLRVYIGKNPPSPLKVNLVLDRDMAVSAEVSAIYENAADIQVNRPNIELNARAEVSASQSLTQGP